MSHEEVMRKAQANIIQYEALLQHLSSTGDLAATPSRRELLTVSGLLNSWNVNNHALMASVASSLVQEMDHVKAIAQALAMVMDRLESMDEAIRVIEAKLIEKEAK